MMKSIYKILFTIFLIMFLIFVVFLVLFTPTHVESEMSVVDTETPVQELQVSCLLMKFEEGTTEPEVKNILGNAVLLDSHLLHID